MFEGLALTLDAAFHLLSQLLIHFEVLDLQLAIPLLLRINEFRGHLELHLGVVIQVAQVRYAFVHILVESWLLSELLSRLGLIVWQMCILERRLAHIHSGTTSFIISHQAALDSDVLHLTRVSLDTGAAK